MANGPQRLEVRQLQLIPYVPDEGLNPVDEIVRLHGEFTSRIQRPVGGTNFIVCRDADCCHRSKL